MLVSVVEDLPFNKPVLFGLKTDDLSFCQGFYLMVMSIPYFFSSAFFFPLQIRWILQCLKTAASAFPYSLFKLRKM